MRKIIVLTPVKNEMWIIDRFLQVTSHFADYIIIADQNSTDGTKEVYKKYPKVIVIENESNSYNEDERQLLLISKARELFGIGNILLAIDADEILSANSMQSDEWKNMINEKKGTILYFQKPCIYDNASFAMQDGTNGWPLGFIDDGTEHQPQKIHSPRIPTPKHAAKIYYKEICFLHYNLSLINQKAMESKMRMYAVVENIKKVNNLRIRRRIYSSRIKNRNLGSLHIQAPPTWFDDWESKGIDMRSEPSFTYYWYDFEVLSYFKKYGEKKFYLDDIWNFNWETARKKGLEMGYSEIPSTPINFPKKISKVSVDTFFDMLNSLTRFKNRLRR